MPITDRHSHHIIYTYYLSNNEKNLTRSNFVPIRSLWKIASTIDFSPKYFLNYLVMRLKRTIYIQNVSVFVKLQDDRKENK